MAALTKTEEIDKFSFVAKRPFGQMNFTSPRSFVDLLRGDFYIDKTMLISLVVKFEKYKIIAIHIPSKWGKSINLDMIKTFLGIQVDNEGRRKSIEDTPSYKLFHDGEIVVGDEIEQLKRPLLISSCKQILKKYLGRYPIVHLDFENLVGSSYTKLMKQIDKRVKNAYDQHPYIEKVIRNRLQNISDSLELKTLPPKRLNKYLDLLQKKLTNEDEIIRSIKLLTEIIYWIHGSRRPYVLVDNYDGILLSVLANSAVSEDGAMRILNFFASLLSLFQTNQFQKRVIFMGTFPLLETIRDLRSIKEYKALNNVLIPFHSISYDSVTLLFERLKVPSFLSTKALNWYKGYRWGKNLNDRIFSMSSIVKFISTGKIDYCNERNIAVNKILDKIVDSLTIRWFLLMRLYGQVWKILPKVQRGMSSKNVMDLKSYLLGKQADEDVFICFPFEPFVRSMGSLAIKNIQDRDSIADSFMIHLTISSNEARFELAEKLMNYYDRNCSISSDLIEQGVENMAKCLNDEDDKNCSSFVSFVEYLSQNVPLVNEMIELNKVRGVTPNVFMSSIFHYLSLRLSLSHDFVAQSVDSEENEINELGLGWPRVILLAERRVVIVEVQVCSSIEYMVNTAKRKHEKYMTRYQKFKEVKFVGVNIAADGGTEIRSEFLKGMSSQV